MTDRATVERKYRVGYDADEYDMGDGYEMLIAPDGREVTCITEPEDRNFNRDLAPIVTELNALLDRAEKAEQSRDQWLESARGRAKHYNALRARLTALAENTERDATRSREVESATEYEERYMHGEVAGVQEKFAAELRQAMEGS